MKPPRLGLPPEVALLVASARRLSEPPEDARDEVRSRLGWAFIENGPTKVLYAPGDQPLHAVQPPAKLAAPRTPWLPFAARAAAAMVLGHVPLALASFGVAIAAIPVTKLLLSRVAVDRMADHPKATGAHRVAQPPPPSTGSPTPSILVLPALAPPPTPFPVEESQVSPPQGAAHPSASQPSAIARIAPTVHAEILNDDTALAAERQLLEQARRALVRGDAIGSLASLDEHSVRYPSSQLAEERDALSVQALLRAGRTGEARLRGIEFRKQYPNSLLLRALGAALRE